MQSPAGIEVAKVSWKVVEDYLSSCNVAVLPVSASCKEHGLHLPMNTDYLQLNWIVEQLIYQRKVLVWPNIGYGYYPAFVNYPGSVTLSVETFMNIVAETLLSIFKHGIEKLVLLNAGISTIAPLEIVLDKPEFRGRTKLCNIYQGRHFKSMEQQLAKQNTGGHADEIETSIMLAIAPEQVEMGKAEAALPGGARPGILQRTDARLENYSKSGVIGVPELATREKGQMLMSAILQDVDVLFDGLIK